MMWLVFAFLAAPASPGDIDPMARSGLIELASPETTAWAFAHCQLEDAESSTNTVVSHADFYPAYSPANMMHDAFERFPNLMIVSEFGHAANRWLFACPTLPRLRQDNVLQKNYPPLTPASPAIVFRVRPLPPASIDPAPRGGVHHFRAGPAYGKRLDEPLPDKLDPHNYNQPGAVFASFIDRLPACLREALQPASDGKPQKPAGKWQHTICKNRHGKPVDVEIAWDEVGNESLYWRFLGLDGPPRR